MMNILSILIFLSVFSVLNAATISSFTLSQNRVNVNQVITTNLQFLRESTTSKYKISYTTKKNSTDKYYEKLFDAETVHLNKWTAALDPGMYTITATIFEDGFNPSEKSLTVQVLGILCDDKIECTVGDDKSCEVELDWTFPIAGGYSNKAYVSTNGYITFDRGDNCEIGYGGFVDEETCRKRIDAIAACEEKDGAAPENVTVRLEALALMSFKKPLHVSLLIRSGVSPEYLNALPFGLDGYLYNYNFFESELKRQIAIASGKKTFKLCETNPKCAKDGGVYKADSKTCVYLASRPDIDSANLEDGEKIYSAKCASCHGADAKSDVWSLPIARLSVSTIRSKLVGYKRALLVSSSQSSSSSAGSTTIVQKLLAQGSSSSTQSDTYKETMINAMKTINEDDIASIAKYINSMEAFKNRKPADLEVVEDAITIPTLTNVVTVEGTPVVEDGAVVANVEESVSVTLADHTPDDFIPALGECSDGTIATKCATYVNRLSGTSTASGSCAVLSSGTSLSLNLCSRDRRYASSTYSYDLYTSTCSMFDFCTPQNASYVVKNFGYPVATTYCPSGTVAASGGRCVRYVAPSNLTCSANPDYVLTGNNCFKAGVYSCSDANQVLNGDKCEVHLKSYNCDGIKDWNGNPYTLVGDKCFGRVLKKYTCPADFNNNSNPKSINCVRLDKFPSCNQLPGYTDNGLGLCIKTVNKYTCKESDYVLNDKYCYPYQCKNDNSNRNGLKCISEPNCGTNGTFSRASNKCYSDVVYSCENDLVLDGKKCIIEGDSIFGGSINQIPNGIFEISKRGDYISNVSVQKCDNRLKVRWIGSEFEDKDKNIDINVTIFPDGSLKSDVQLPDGSYKTNTKMIVR